MLGRPVQSSATTGAKPQFAGAEQAQASPRGPGLRAGSVPTWAAATGCTITSSTPYVAARLASWARAVVGVADHPARAHRVHQGAVGVGDVDLLGLLDQELRAERGAGAEGDHHQQVGQRPPLGLLGGLGHHGVDREEGPRLGQLGARDGRWSGRARAPRRSRSRRSGGRRRRASPSRRPAGPSSRRSRAARSSGPSGPPAWRASAWRAAGHAQPDAVGLHHRQHVVDVLREPRDVARRSRPPAPCRSANDVTGSVPGARPMPRSIRPG